MDKKNDNKDDKKSANEYHEIIVDNIVTEGQSVRELIDNDHVVELAMSIATHGLLEPIVVSTLPGAKYQLRAGLHRLAAYTRLKRYKIPAHIIDDTNTPVRATALVENICRTNMSLKEETEAINHLHKTENLSPGQICALVGKSREWVNRRLMIPGLPADIRERLMDNRISLKHAEILGAIEDDGARHSVTNAAIQNNFTAAETAELAKMYLATPSFSEAVNAGLETITQQQTAPPATRACALCGKFRPLVEITWIPVCMYGCDNEPHLKNKEE